MSETAIVVLEVRNDKDRGNLVVTIRKLESEDVYFFKHHHQPINKHPEQIQRLVELSKPTTRTKSINVNIMAFVTQYFNVSKLAFEFKGVKLNSSNQQVSKVFNLRINKEIGILKRKQTIANTKEEKLAEKNRKILEKLASDEARFQAERAERIVTAMADMQTD